MTEPQHALGTSPGGAREVRAPLAPLLREPRISAELLSQLPRGRQVSVVEAKGEWLRVRDDSGYEGWTHAGYLGRTEGERYMGARRISLGCEITGAAGTLRLPLGASVFEGEQIVAGAAVPPAGLAVLFPPKSAVVAAAAARLFGGAPYLWGGVSPWGADCSGFVQSLFWLHGAQLPRDSRDQARAGERSPGTPESAAAAELLFFSEREDGAITHVGVALGEGRMAHVALGRGGFALEDFTLRVGAEEYVARLRTRFKFARRVLSV